LIRSYHDPVVHVIALFVGNAAQPNLSSSPWLRRSAESRAISFVMLNQNRRAV
jgi:hypothetical protein